MFNLFTGAYLFSGKSAQELMDKNKECDLTHVWELTKNLSENARNLLKRTLEKDPNLRFTAQEALAHPWFASDR